MVSPSVAPAARRTSTRQRKPRDAVEQMAAITISDSSGDDIQVAPQIRRTSSRKGKAPVVDQSLDDHNNEEAEEDDEDIVSEYTFSSEPDYDDEGAEDDFDDSRSVISVSSESSEPPVKPMTERPWKLGDFTINMRRQWEYMYANLTAVPVAGSWEGTEDYQQKKDEEMRAYLEDFPLQDWVIPREDAERAYEFLMQRTRWRTMGVRIYDRFGRVTDMNGPPDLAFSSQQRPPSSGPGRELRPNAPLQSDAPSPHGHQVAPPQMPQQMPPQGLRPQGPPSQQGPHQMTQQMLQQPQQVPQQMPQQMAPQMAQQMPQQMPYQGPPGPMPPQGPPGAPLPHHHFPPGPHLPQGSPSHLPPGTHQSPLPFGLPPPPQQLISQPYGQPIGPPMAMHHIGRPIGPPQHIPYGMPTFAMHRESNFPLGNEPPKPRGMFGRRTFNQKEPSLPTTPPPPPPTPPYPLREKPIETKGKLAGRRAARRQAEAEEFPWTRNLNFPEEKAKAAWDDSLYNPVSMREMEAIRTRNVSIIDDLDAKVQEQQRLARQSKKAREVQAQQPAESSEVEGDGKEKKKMQRGQRKGESGGDPYHSGAYAFASDEDEQLAVTLNFKNPDDMIEAAEQGALPDGVTTTIKICWNPGKKGTTENLEQVKFTIRDTVVTKKQVQSRNVLTRRAAECIIDFCPDMLWRGMLLRICSEAGMGNKDVRDRFCYNGCYCDKATITKRISAALGQKQVQPKSKGYGPGEYEWYDENVKDFAKYIDYFGKRQSHRNMLKIQMQGEKRKAMLMRKEGAAAASDDADAGSSAKKPRLDSEDGGDNTIRSRGTGPNSPTVLETSDGVPESEGADGEGADGEGADGHESDASDNSNAVSIQDSEILDKIEDD